MSTPIHFKGADYDSLEPCRRISVRPTKKSSTAWPR